MLIPARVSTRRFVAAASRVAWYAALSLLAAPTATRAAAEPAKKPWTVDDVLRVRDLTEPQVSPDGRWVVFVVSEADDAENAYNTDLYLLPADGAGTGRTVEATRLTRSPKPDHRPRFSPDGRTIAFLSGRESAGDPGGGGEAAARDEKGEQVWLIRPDGGEPWQPAALEGSVSDFAWSPDGTLLALLVREPKSEDRRKREKDKDDAQLVDSEIRRDQVFVMDARTGVAVQATRGSVHFTALDWAPDGRRLALAGQPTPKVPDDFKSDIYTLDLTAALRALRDQAGRREQTAGGPRPVLADPVPLVTTKGADGHPRFSPDGSTLVFLTQDGSEEWYTNQYVATAPAAGGAPRVLTRAFDEEAEDPRFTADGKAIVFEGQARLARHLFSVPSGGGDIRRLTPGDDVHREISWSRDGRIAALVRESPTRAPEVAVLEAASKRSGPAIRPLSHINDWSGEYATIAKEPFRWKGKDGLDLEGLLIRPAGAASGKSAPLLVVVHGGPAGSFANTFTVRRGVYPVQLFAQKGFAVLMPNPRGSGGYGEAFRKANVRDWGGADYDDIMAGIDALVAAGSADPARLGIMGWSYGGFMTSRVLTKTDRFKAASVGAAVTDTVSFVGVTDIPPFMRSYFNAWPWEDPSVYTSHTAIYNASAITTPTLIQHGEADARVPISQGWELYVALKEKGVPVEFVTYPRQGHPLLEPKLIRDAMRRNLEWFSRFIPVETVK
jgi:dipeptidyl aminopeptidase/acylaminoacyl peptidase